MKLLEIANRIDKSKKNEDWISTEDIGEELEIDVPYVDQDRLKCYWIGHWCCTDTWVGYRMYFLDDEPVAYSTQRGRKYDEEFHWFSIETATKVKEYLLSLSEKEMNINICDINKEFGNSFKIEFNSQIINEEHITIHGEKVAIVERIKKEQYGMDKTLIIQLPSGETKEVNIKELDFNYHII